MHSRMRGSPLPASVLISMRILPVTVPVPPCDHPPLRVWVAQELGVFVSIRLLMPAPHLLKAGVTMWVARKPHMVIKRLHGSIIPRSGFQGP